jgi:alanyl-tRNA synthetase
VVYNTNTGEQSVDLDALAKTMPDLFHSPHQTAARGGEARVLSAYDDKLKMARHHTATHLLQEALRRVLGDHVQQAGSLVDTDRLRFDFTHYQAMTHDQVREVETLVNQMIASQLPVSIDHMTLDEAKAKGATALFGEKYDADCVRMVSIGGDSIELCGGTHVSNTGMIEVFKLIHDTAISSGTRRIEALAGHEAVSQYLSEKRQAFMTKIASRLQKLEGLSQQVSGSMAEAARVLINRTPNDDEFSTYEEEIVTLTKQLEKQLESQQASQLSSVADQLIASKQISSRGYDVVTGTFDLDMNSLKILSEDIRAKSPNTLMVLAASQGGFLVSKGSQVSTDISSPQILNGLTQVAGGKGGGRPDFAQAGGADPAKINEALLAFQSQFL